MNGQLSELAKELAVSFSELKYDRSTMWSNGHVGDVKITIGPALTIDYQPQQAPKSEIRTVSEQDLILDKALAFSVREKHLTDLFDLLWALSKSSVVKPDSLKNLMDQERQSIYGSQVKGDDKGVGSDDKQSTKKQKHENLATQFAATLQNMLAQGANRLFSRFEKELNVPKAAMETPAFEDTFKGLAKSFGIHYADKPYKVGIAIQQGNFTGDMFGAGAAILLTSSVHVVILKEKSTRDKTGDILSFYKAMLKEDFNTRVHVLELPHPQKYEEHYKKYTTQRAALPYSQLTPPLPVKLQNLKFQQPIGLVTTTTAESWQKGSRERIRESWGLPRTGEEDKRAALFEEFLTHKGAASGQKYAILWSRSSGKKGGPHAQHDTSGKGMTQLIEAVPSTMMAIIAGDKMNKPVGSSRAYVDLTEFWKDPLWQKLFPVSDRLTQIALFDFLKTRSSGLKHLGFRSGNLEAYALAGHEVRYLEEEGNLQAERMTDWDDQSAIMRGKQQKIGYKRMTVKQVPTLTGQWVTNKVKSSAQATEPDIPWFTRSEESQDDFTKITYGQSKEEKSKEIQESAEEKKKRRGFLDPDLEEIKKYLEG